MVAEDVHPVTALPTVIASLPITAAVILMFGWSWGAFPDWLGVVRILMMVLGGMVVIAIVLIVAIAVISGVMGMIGNLRKRS